MYVLVVIILTEDSAADTLQHWSPRQQATSDSTYSVSTQRLIPWALL